MLRVLNLKIHKACVRDLRRWRDEVMSRKLNFERRVTLDNAMSADEVASTEKIVARLVAAAIAADHPDLFADKSSDGSIMGSRPEPRLARKDGVKR
jgi:hypothetical protein